MTSSRNFFLPLLLASLLPVLSCGARHQQAAAGPKGGTAAAPAATPVRCSVCAMDVAPNEALSASITLADGTVCSFCGTRCFFLAWLEPETLLDAKPKNVARGTVREFTGGKDVDAASVVFVAGSDVKGAMGPAIVAVLPGDVAAFKARHGGTVEFRLSELSPRLLAQVRAKTAPRP